MIRVHPVPYVGQCFLLNVLLNGLLLAMCDVSFAMGDEAQSNGPKIPHWTLKGSWECFIGHCAWYAPMQKPIEFQPGFGGRRELLPPGTLYLTDRTVELEREECGQMVKLSSRGLLQVQILRSGTLRILGVGTIEYAGTDKVGPCYFKTDKRLLIPAIEIPPVQAGSLASSFTIHRATDSAIQVHVQSGKVLLSWMDSAGQSQQQLSSGQWLNVDADAVKARVLELSTEALSMIVYRKVQQETKTQLSGNGFPSQATQDALRDEFLKELKRVVRYGVADSDPGPLQYAWYRVLRYVDEKRAGEAALQLYAMAKDSPLTPVALYQAWARLTLHDGQDPAPVTARTQLQTDLEAALLVTYPESVWAKALPNATNPPHQGHEH